jgi:large subunit ribosomal protein L6
MSQESRILMRAERTPLVIPEGVQVEQQGLQYTFTSSKGSLSYRVHTDVDCKIEGNAIHLSLLNLKSKSQVGTTRARFQNIIQGLTAGFEKKLLLVGVGYKANLEGASRLVLNLGKSHKDIYEIPAGISINLPNQTEIILAGIDKVQLGQVAADIRSLRPPEPYKGKGIRYSDEVISLKEVKKQ